MIDTAVAAELSAAKPRRLLLVASSASDLTEIEDMAKVLATRGSHVTLVYLYSEGCRQVHANALAKVSALDGFVGRVKSFAVDLDCAVLEPTERKPSSLEAKKSVFVRYGKKAGEGFRRVTEINPKAVLRRWMDARGWWEPARVIRRRLNDGARLRLSTLHTLLSAPPILARYQAHLAGFRALIERLACDAILVPEDVVGDVWPLLIRAGHDKGIPTLIFPYTLANREEAVKSLRGQLAFQSKYNRAAALIFRRWRMRADGCDIVRMPSGHIVAHEWLKIAPPDPWMMNSGFANVICVDSQSSRDYFKLGGIPERKLLVTGSVSQDFLHSQLQDKQAGLALLRGELRLSGTKPLLLISGCPNQLAGSVPSCQFASIEEIADHVGRTVASLRDSYHLVVCPHPNFPYFGELLRSWGVTSTTIPTSRLVPLSDLFVAFASATIRWAVACAVPTINYDVFHYCYGDFSDAHGVRTVTDARDFYRAVSDMAPGSAAYSEAKTLIEADASHWSMIDGGCAERIEAAIDAECRKGWAQRSSS